MKSSRIKNSVLIALFLITVCVSLLTPINDTDFFWHLAAGKWAVEHGGLPKTDPFSYTTSLMAQEQSYRVKIILTQYWLAELLLYAVFSVGGVYGIILLRVVIYLLTLLILAVHMRRRGLSSLTALILLLPVFFVLLDYVGDRPNQMTFLFTALFMFLADSLKRGERKGYFLPVVFVLWANIHGGFVLGAVIVVIMLAAELLRKFFMTGHATNRRLVTVLLATLGAGFINPNGYAVFYSMVFEGSSYYYASILEAMTPWSFTGMGIFLYIFILGISVFMTVWYLVSVLLGNRAGIKDAMLAVCDELLVVAFLLAISFSAIRYIPLLVIVNAPLAACLFSGRFQEALKRGSAYMLPELALAAVFAAMIYGVVPDTVLKRPPVSPMFPDDAVQFIKEGNMNGRFLNYYDWGGYLIWRFYPAQFVFSDGRGISQSVFYDTSAVIDFRGGAFEGTPLYRSVLDAYSVRHLIIPAVKMNGDIIYLIKALESDPEWRLIFMGRNSLVYTRDPGYRDYPKALGYVLAVSNAMEMMKLNPENPFPYLTYAKANSYMGRSNVAIEGLDGALHSHPSLRVGAVEKALNLLKEGKDIPVDMSY